LNGFPDSIWGQIACTSFAVWATISKWERTPSIGHLIDCKTSAVLFLDVFNFLEIPYSDVGIFNGSFRHSSGKLYTHVVNRFTVSGKDGSYYTYIIDTGFMGTNSIGTGKLEVLLFPLTHPTIHFHDRDKNGVVDSQALPELWNDE